MLEAATEMVKASRFSLCLVPRMEPEPYTWQASRSPLSYTPSSTQKPSRWNPFKLNIWMEGAI